jgi:hypothetical protein
LADKASIIIRKETEWMLNSDLLSKSLNSLKFSPDVDLFATRINKQFKKYIAYRCDPGAFAVDAFTMNRNSLNFYAFPLFSLITRVLQKIKMDKATGVIVVPNWPTQIWFSKLTRLLIAEPILLPTGKKILHLPSDPKVVHPLYKNLNMPRKYWIFIKSSRTYRWSIAKRNSKTI